MALGKCLCAFQLRSLAHVHLHHHHHHHHHHLIIIIINIIINIIISINNIINIMRRSPFITPTLFGGLLRGYALCRSEIWVPEDPMVVLTFI